MTMTMKTAVLSCLVVLLLLSAWTVPGRAADDGQETEVFVPTNEWQDVKAGQSVPAGLEIRMDLATGVRMARLPQEPIGRQLGGEAAGDAAADGGGGSGSGSSGGLVPAEVEKEERSGDDASAKPNATAEQEERDRERALHHLGRTLVKMLEQDETARIIELLKMLNRDQPDENKTENNQVELLTMDEALEAFSELEDLLHGTDNAADFAKMNGLDTLLRFVREPEQHVIMTPGSESKWEAMSIERVRWHALWVLGVAAQNEPTVQTAALDAGVVEDLVAILESVPHPVEAGEHSKMLREEQLRLQGKALYALNALARSMHTARGWDEILVRHDGLDLLRRLIRRHSVSENAVGAQSRLLARKALSLVHSALVDSKFNWPIRRDESKAAGGDDNDERLHNVHTPEELERLDVQLKHRWRDADWDSVSRVDNVLNAAFADGKQPWCALLVDRLVHANDHVLQSTALDVVTLLLRDADTASCTSAVKGHADQLRAYAAELRGQASSSDDYEHELAERLDKLMQKYLV